MDSGIYTIRHIQSGRLYVGSSVRIAHRWYCHRKTLRAGKHHSPYLQNAWNKYGEDSFEFTIIERCDQDKATLLEREQHYIDTLQPVFNYAKHAGSRLGVSVSSEVREKIRRGLTGFKRLEKTHCIRGHEFTPANTHRSKKQRHCLTCARDKATEQRRARGAPLKSRSHCPRGHSYTERDYDSKGKRSCRTCARERVREKRRANGAQPRGPYRLKER